MPLAQQSFRPGSVMPPSSRLVQHRERRDRFRPCGTKARPRSIMPRGGVPETARPEPDSRPRG